jgi:hypothetical protein
LTPRKKSKKGSAVEAGTRVEIPLSNVEKANLVPELPGGTKKKSSS